MKTTSPLPALLASASWFALISTTSAAVIQSVGTTGTFDENTNATNPLDIEIPAATLGAFKTSVLSAYNNYLGGVIDWETGMSPTLNASATTSANNTMPANTAIKVAYGTSGNQILAITFDRTMQLYTNNVNSQINALSSQGSFSNAIIPDGQNLAVGLEYNMSFSGADVIEFGAAMPSRSTYALNGVTAVNFRATVTYSTSAPTVLDFSVGGVPGTGDTFLHFTAPSGEKITSFGVKWMSETGGTAPLANGQRRPVLDDFGFVLAAPANTYATWISGKPGVNGQTAVNQDPDVDGIDNGVENFFGTEPGVFSQGLQAGGVSGSTFTFTHPVNATPALDLTATYRWSKDLVTFTPGGGTHEGTTVNITPGTPSGGLVTVTAVASGTPTGKLFIHAQVTQP